MKPDRSNYEIWLIDYLDGKLDENRGKELFSFFEENPGLGHEFEEISGFKIRPQGNSFVNKDLLKKTYSDLSAEQFEFLCVAATENDLEDEQKAELDAMASEDPQKRKTLDLFKKIKLTAPAIKYKKKSYLRKLTLAQKVIRLSVIGISAAAGIALIISLFNTPVKSGNEFKALISTNSSANVNRADNQDNKISGNTSKKETREKIRPVGISVQNTLIKTNPVENEVARERVAEPDTFRVKAEVHLINIAKADYKPEVNLVKESFAGTLATVHIAEISPPEAIERSGLNTMIAKFFREKILKSREAETGSLKPYEIADAGILGLNKLLGWQMSLQKNHDEKGDLKSLYFSSKILKFNAPVRKVQLRTVTFFLLSPSLQ